MKFITSVYPKSIQRRGLRHTQLQFQVTMSSQCFSCFKYLYSASLLWVPYRSVPSLRKFLEVPKESRLSSSCVCAFDLSYCLLLPFSILYLCVCICVNVHKLLMHLGDNWQALWRGGFIWNELPWVHQVSRLAMDKH